MSIYEKFGDYYDLIYQGTVNYEKECDALEKIFAKLCQRKPKSILDVGCGTGSHAVILSKRGYNVTGIDISKTMIKKAKEKAKKETNKIIDECCLRGLLLLSCGENTIRFMPPLIIKKEELDLALQIFDDSLKEVEK